MAPSPSTSWQINGETMETVRDFILGGSKITADGDCSHEIKRYLLLGRKVMTNLSSVQSLSHVRLFETPRIAARWASLSITIFRSSLNSHQYLTNRKTIVLTRRTFAGKIMSLFLICCLGWS